MNTESGVLAKGTMLFQQYRIETTLGQGGFGITYLAYDINLNQQVAVKEFLPTAFATRARDHAVLPKSELHKSTFIEFKTKFLEEARTLACFKHPHMVRVQNYFEANGTAYLVMEYEAGVSLESLLKKNIILSEQQLLSLLHPLLDALEVLHASGIIHRDIKPDNIYIRADGSPVLLDFGSARHAMGGKTNTMTTLLTPGYAPMEQYYTDAKQQGSWSDIYALGAVLYRAVTGGKPVESSLRSAARVRATVDPLAPAATKCRGNYSPQLLEFIDQALMILGEDRPQNIKAWRALLANPQSANNAISISDPTELMTAATIQKPGRTKPIKWLIASSLVVLTLVSITVIIVRYYDLKVEVTTAKPHEAPLISADNPDLQAANNGDANAQFLVGSTYFHNQDTDQGNKAALQWLQKAAKQDHAEAQYLLGVMHLDGRGVEQSDDAALKWLQKATALHNANAEHLLGMAHLEGRAVEQNDAKAVEWFKKAAQQQHAEAAHQLGVMLLEGRGAKQDNAKALAWLQSAAAEDHGDAQFQLGMMYDEGQGVDKDDDKSWHWYNKAFQIYFKAADEDNDVAQQRLGQMYENGLGVVQDQKKALEWYQRAAKQNNPEAQYHLGSLYLDGQHVNRDINTAFMWLQKSAENGFDNAQFQLGELFASGAEDVVPVDTEQAAAMYQKAAEQGHMDAQYNLGLLLLAGDGLTQDNDTAREWLSQAAEQGHEDAQHKLEELSTANK